jgi:hypothetical protein
MRALALPPRLPLPAVSAVSAVAAGAPAVPGGTDLGAAEEGAGTWPPTWSPHWFPWRSWPSCRTPT